MKVEWNGQEMEFIGLSAHEVIMIIAIHNEFSDGFEAAIQTTVLLCKNRGYEVKSKELYESDFVEVAEFVSTVAHWASKYIEIVTMRLI